MEIQKYSIQSTRKKQNKRDVQQLGLGARCAGGSFEVESSGCGMVWYGMKTKYERVFEHNVTLCAPLLMQRVRR